MLPFSLCEAHPTTEQSIAYLSIRSNRALTKAVQEVLNTEPGTARNIVQASLLSGRLRMLDVCENLLSLETLKNVSGVENPVTDACDEAEYFAPPSPAEGEWLFIRALKHIAPRSELVARVARYMTETVAWSYQIELDTPPTNQYAALNQMNFLRTVASDVRWLGGLLLDYFVTTWKVALAAGTLFASLLGLRYLYHYCGLDTPQILDPTVASSLTEKAAAGKCRPTVGRHRTLLKLEQSLSALPGEQPLIPFLVGPPGVGKTQLVEGLTLRIFKGDCPRLQGKKVMYINTAKLRDFGGFSSDRYASRVELLLKALKGHEQELILFFDEAHNASHDEGQEPDGPDLLETLKTELLERNILCIFATTTEEYARSIQTHPAFVSRIRPIDVGSLPEKETALVLAEHFGPSSPLPIEYDAYQRAAESAAHTEELLPRAALNLFREKLQATYAWRPTHIQATLDAADQTLRGLRERRASVEEIRAHKKYMEGLERRRTEEKVVHARLRQLQHLERAYAKEMGVRAHQIAAGQRDNKQLIRYLFLTHLLLPELRRVIPQVAGELENLCSEKPPLSISAASFSVDNRT
jgi:hypothetical protein